MRLLGDIAFLRRVIDNLNESLNLDLYKLLENSIFEKCILARFFLN